MLKAILMKHKGNLNAVVSDEQNNASHLNLDIQDQAFNPITSEHSPTRKA